MHRNRINLGHIGLALVPLALTPALLFSLAEGWVNLGGGEKDILLVVPFFILALVFFTTSVILILKRWTLGRWIVRSCLVSFSVLVLLGLVAYMTSWLGIA